MSQSPPIRDGVVIFEPPSPENVELLIRWTLDPLAQGPFKRVPPMPERDLRALFLDSADRSYFLLRRASDREPLGRFYWRAWRFREPGDVLVDWELNIIIARPDERGRGYGTAAQRAAAGYLAQRQDTASVFAFTLVGNTAEQRALVKAGFENRGQLPNPRYPVDLPPEPCVLFVWPLLVGSESHS